jgi:hypothetical protein
MDIEDIIAQRAATRDAILALEAMATTEQQRSACRHGHHHLERADEYLLPVLVELSGHVIEPFDGDPKPPH